MRGTARSCETSGGVASFAAMILVLYFLLAMSMERGNTPDAVVVQRTAILGGF